MLQAGEKFVEITLTSEGVSVGAAKVVMERGANNLTDKEFGACGSRYNMEHVWTGKPFGLPTQQPLTFLDKTHASIYARESEVIQATASLTQSVKDALAEVEIEIAQMQVAVLKLRRVCKMIARGGSVQ